MRSGVLQAGIELFQARALELVRRISYGLEQVGEENMDPPLVHEQKESLQIKDYCTQGISAPSRGTWRIMFSALREGKGFVVLIREILQWMTICSYDMRYLVCVYRGMGMN